MNSFISRDSKYSSGIGWYAYSYWKPSERVLRHSLLPATRQEILNTCCPMFSNGSDNCQLCRSDFSFLDKLLGIFNITNRDF